MIREARLSDMRSIGEVLAAAFRDEELWGKLMHPKRHEFFDDYITFFERKLRNQWFSHRRVLLVAEDEGKVAGIAVWERHGKGGEARDLYRVDPRRLLVPAASLAKRLSIWWWPDRAADPSKANILEESFPFFASHWNGKREENWELELLAVDPKSQGKYLGAQLVKWGVEEARKDGICASVVAAHEKEGFYAKFGFVEVGRANVGPLGKAGIKGGAIMFIDI